MNNAIAVLDKLLTSQENAKKRRPRRLEELLKKPQESSEGWYMYVPKCFNLALDLQRTVKMKEKRKQLVWTQGSRFSFQQGDLIYDTSQAYQGWLQALQYMKLCVQVREAISVSPATKTLNRVPGEVKFDVLIPDEQKQRLIKKDSYTFTQDEFVKFLISGSSKILL